MLGEQGSSVKTENNQDGYYRKVAREELNHTNDLLLVMEKAPDVLGHHKEYDTSVRRQWLSWVE